MKLLGSWIVRAIVLALFVGALWPVERVIVPEWTITAVRSGRPVPGVSIRENWRDSSVLASESEEYRTSDQRGRVTFPRRVTRVSRLHRTFACTGEVLMQGFHASCGPSAFIAAQHDGFEGWLNYEPGKPPQSVLVLERR